MDGKPPTAGWVRPGSGEKVNNPTDRGKKGTKKSVLVEGEGGPLGLAIEGANVPDCKMLRATIEAIVVSGPNPRPDPQHLSLDKGYDNPTGRQAAVDAKIPHTSGGSARRTSRVTDPKDTNPGGG